MRSKRSNKEDSKNYLDYIPAKVTGLYSETDPEENTTIYMENKELFNFAAQQLLQKPKISQIHLDEFGNFIWPLIDGKRTIYDIGVAVKEKFGDRAEPLYERLIQYLRTMESYGFITLSENEKQG